MLISITGAIYLNDRVSEGENGNSMGVVLLTDVLFKYYNYF